jgi:hypothetical protein
MSLELALLLSRKTATGTREFEGKKITFDAAQQKCPFTVNLPVIAGLR